ncbi:MAG TPA: type III polyketide synthase [Ignavibacteriaceae bacterium]
MLIDIETASPPYCVLQSKAASELKKRMTGSAAAGRLIDMAAAHSGIDQRFIVIPDAESDDSDKFYSRNGSYVSPDTGRRMVEYEKWAKELSKTAVRKVIEHTGFNPGELNKLITISCTGFFAPGLDYYLINEFDFPPDIKRTNIGFMGCAASLIGFGSVLEAMSLAGTSNVLLISVELCSLHLQTEPTRDNILANMIFADGCGAALFSNSGRYSSNVKLDLIKTDSVLFKNSAEYMGWRIGNNGFEMILSSDLPKIILNEAVPSLISILQKQGLDVGSINHWALHPGGRAILDSLQAGLKLSDTQMKPSRAVLRNYGNLSSASILFVLKELMESVEVRKDELCCAVAFGPGLTMEIALFRGS